MARDALGAGSLTEVVTVEREALDADGLGTGQWAAVGQIRAAVKGVRWREDILRKGDAIRTVGAYQFTGWANAIAALQVSAFDRLIWAGNVYSIREVRTPPDSENFCEIIAESGVTQ